LLTKARAGRDFGSAQPTNEEAADLILWSFNLVSELVLEESSDNGLNLGYDGFEQSHEGAFRLLGRIVLPKQGFYGKSACVSEDGKRISMPFQGGIWECELEKLPFKFGLEKALGMEVIKGKNDWESLGRAPIRANGKGIWFTSSSLDPEEKYLVCCGEDGLVVVFRRFGKEKEAMQLSD